MEMTDKERYERIRETLGEHLAVIEFARVEEGEAIKWLNETAALHSTKIEPDASRELVDSLGGDMMMISNELEKLLLYVGEKKRITLGDVETMVLAAKQRTLYELTDALSSHNRARSLEILDAMLSTGDGDEAAIGHLYMLARTFRQMLVILERNVRDTRALYQVLWQGFRIPPFAAEDVIRQARRYKSRRELTRAIRLISRADAALRTNPVSKRLSPRKSHPRPRRRTQNNSPPPGSRKLSSTNSAACSCFYSVGGGWPTSAFLWRMWDSRCGARGCCFATNNSPWVPHLRRAAFARLRWETMHFPRRLLRLLFTFTTERLPPKRKRQAAACRLLKNENLLRCGCSLHASRKAALVARCRVLVQNALLHALIQSRNRLTERRIQRSLIAGGQCGAQ